MRELTRTLLLLLCFRAYCSVFAAAGDELNLWCIEKEREALLEFKKGLIDDEGSLSSWGSEEDKRECCQWKGIECSHDSGHVIALQLGNCEQEYHIYLRGENISSALLELKYLTHLDLSCIYFGNFPYFIGSMVKLQHLNFHGSLTSSVVGHQLADLTNLRTLDLGDNSLFFDNLHWLSRLSSLSFLDLSGSNLTNINSLQEIFNLPSLKELYLSSCYLPTYFSVNSSSTSLSVLNLSFIITSSSFHWLFNISSSLRSIDLSYNHLDSNIASDFGRFAFLEHLDLSSNELTGGIPESWGNLSHLQILDLSSNHLTGGIPKYLGNLSHLQILDLSENQLTGGLPKSLSGLSHLQILDLSQNILSESLPQLFNKLPVGVNQSLEILKLHKNDLYGSVPDVTCLPSLRILRLQKNKLNGSFSHGFAHISKLEVLDLSNNQIRGSVPDLTPFVSLRELHLGGNKLKLLPTTLAQLSLLEKLDLSSISGKITEIHLFKLHNLKHLDLSFNSLAFNVSDDWIPPFQLNVLKLAMCNISPHFPTWLRTQTNLSRLDLSSNSISEKVPKWFWDFSPKIGYLNLSHNQIIGSIPDLSSMNYEILDISYNHFSGPLPLLPLNSAAIFLSDNMFVGSISSICTTSYWFLSTLDLSNNRFSGELPDCWENSSSLVILNLANNKFSGNIPHSFGSLHNLKMLRLGNNNFSGELPSTLMNCSYMLMLDVGGNNLRGKIPAWIGTNLTFLYVLSLRNNSFSGDIPTEICSLTGIQILDLSRNFLSGKLPQCFNNCNSWVQKDTLFYSSIWGFDRVDYYSELYIDHVLVQWKRQQVEYRKTTVGLVKLIDLSNNRLIGNIPDEFSQLKALISLNLSRNNLGGRIIPNIGEMEELEILDLSTNKFSGEIPKGLANLDRLAVLDLSNNHLSGRIPWSTKLQGFEPSWYVGNDGLCGLPLTRCPGDEPNPSTTQLGKQEISVDDGFMAQLHSHEFYIPIVLGLIVGFWGAVGTLVLNSSWRNAYFNFFSRTGDWLYVTTMIYAGRLKRSFRNNVPN